MNAARVSAFRARLEEAGLGLLGSLTADEYDALVPASWRTSRLHPDAREWIVVASGGRELFAAFEASAFAQDTEPDPLDRFVRSAVDSACREFPGARAFFYDEAREGDFADFVALGRACGLAAPGALGLAMHAEFGPWWSIRALIGVIEPVELPKLVAADSPCLGCAAPCVDACRGAAVLGPRGDLGLEPFDTQACVATRLSDPACAERCDARRACPVGAEHAYSRAAEAHHLGASLAWIRAGSAVD